LLQMKSAEMIAPRDSQKQQKVSHK
jgi:hypothetical protein